MDQYVSDLEQLIFVKKHQLVAAVAEQKAVNDRKVIVKEQCDQLAADNKMEELVKKWQILKFYQDRGKILEEKIKTVGEELGVLQVQKLHMQLVHLDQ